ncbi:MAG: 3'(2'),5'-bisphosphate nucleotidase CysQ [Chloroflexi bacterium]|nr:3'(2'),5'-bisphosphate nucleotidase CysQ [Chloroflexota bacterium]
MQTGKADRDPPLRLLVIDHAPRDSSATDDLRLAASLAEGAGRVLCELRAQVDAGSFRADAAELKAAGDAAAQAYIAATLADSRPGDAILSEEAADDPQRLSADRVWIVDPLDGTREFAERLDDGTWRDDFAVHIALWQRGRGVTDAAVGLPGRDRVLDSDGAADRDATAAQAVLAGQRPLRLAASRTRPPAIVHRLAERADVELVPMGSTGIKVLAVIDGTVDAYIHAGGQYEWDSAAPVAVAQAVGLIATRLDGSPLVYNQADPWCPDLVICDPALLPYLRTMLSEAGLDDEPGVRA